MKHFAFLLLVFSLPALLFAQQPNGELCLFRVDGTDTIMHKPLKAAYVVAFKKGMTEKEKKRYKRLVRHVKKVYPYAKMAGEKLRKYDDTLRQIESDRARKKMMKKVEKEIRDEFEGDLRNLTIRQGKILVKLIDRECNDSSYALLKELRGTVSAALWQGVGRVFGYNLKIKYDPTGRDKEIEKIVRLIELGAI